MLDYPRAGRAHGDSHRSPNGLGFTTPLGGHAGRLCGTQTNEKAPGASAPRAFRVLAGVLDADDPDPATAGGVFLGVAALLPSGTPQAGSYRLQVDRSAVVHERGQLRCRD